MKQFKRTKLVKRRKKFLAESKHRKETREFNRKILERMAELVEDETYMKKICDEVDDAFAVGGTQGLKEYAEKASEKAQEEVQAS